MEVLELKKAFDRAGQVDAEALTRKLHITKREFALAVGLPTEAITRAKRRESTRTQQRLRETLEILNRVQEWAGGINAAWSWYRSQPIPALGGLTAEELVTQNRAYEVDCASILDLTTPENLQRYRTTEQALSCAWLSQHLAGDEPESWAIARRLIEKGIAGIQVHSQAVGAKQNDINVVFWDWSTDKPRRVAVIDDEGRLKK